MGNAQNHNNCRFIDVHISEQSNAVSWRMFMIQFRKLEVELFVNSWFHKVVLSS
jgi:hypothetical protein